MLLEEAYKIKKILYKKNFVFNYFYNKWQLIF